MATIENCAAYGLAVQRARSIIKYVLNVGNYYQGRIDLDAVPHIRQHATDIQDRFKDELLQTIVGSDGVESQVGAIIADALEQAAQRDVYDATKACRDAKRSAGDDERALFGAIVNQALYDVFTQVPECISGRQSLPYLVACNMCGRLYNTLAYKANHAVDDAELDGAFATAAAADAGVYAPVAMPPDPDAMPPDPVAMPPGPVLIDLTLDDE